MIRRFEIYLTVLVLVLCANRGQAVDSLVLSQARLGNIFLTTETVQIPLQTTGDQVSWTAKDFFGVTTTGPMTPVPGNGIAIIEPDLGRLGYFELRVTALRDGSPVATADTTFAVIAPSTVTSTPDSPFGVMTHFAHGWTYDILQLLSRAGIVHFRDEQYWQFVEPTRTTPPTYTFAPYAPYMTAAAGLGMDPLMVLDFANTNYDGGATPYTADGRTGYANYATALLAQYGSQIKAVSIWNEYNGSFSNGVAKQSPFYYTEMLKTSYTAIKAVRPDVRVVGGACVPVPIPWFENLFALGAHDYLDILDAHPYRAIPEGVEDDLTALKNLSASYNHGNGPKPIWATECGAPDLLNPVGRQNMSSYMVRLMTLMRTVGVERAYWYLAYDYDGYSLGLVRAPGDPLGSYTPSSAYPTYANLIKQLYGATYVSREVTDTRTRIYRFDRSGTDLRVVWASTGTSQIVLYTSTPLTRINIMGETTVLQPTNGAIAVTATETPYYLVGAINTVREIGRDVIVADSVSNFTSTQGTANGTWYYGETYIETGVPYNPNTTNTLSPLIYRNTNFGSDYKSPNNDARLDVNGGHPAVRGGYAITYPIWAVRRWHSNAAGPARITGNIVRASPYGDGTGIKMFVDGTEVYSTTLGGAGTGATVNFDFTAPIQVGSKVDVAITPGPGLDIDFDYVDFRLLISVPLQPPPTFAAWQEQNFTAAEFIDPNISGDNAAPAGDGIHNLLKYSSSTSAKAFTSAALPVLGSIVVGTDTFLTLSYRKAIAPTDLVFIPEVNAGSLAAGSWAPGGVQVGPPVDNGDGTQTITVRDTVPITPEVPSRYMRLRVQKP